MSLPLVKLAVDGRSTTDIHSHHTELTQQAQELANKVHEHRTIALNEIAIHKIGSMNRGETEHLLSLHTSHGVYTSQDQENANEEFDSSNQIQQQLPPLTKQLASALFVISLMFLSGMLVGICLKPSSVIAAFTQQPSRAMMNRLKPPARSAVTAKCTHQGSIPSRRLIVDTDLGLDDLVAIAILRVQQSMMKVDVNSNHKYKHFHLSGVTITPGVSHANMENAALLQRLLPPSVPVYYSAHTALSYTERDKPKWWTRTAERVKQFLLDLPPPSQSENQTNSKYMHDITAEQFIASNLDDPNVDYLCMAPLTTVANAIFRYQQKDNEDVSSPKATFYIMGGIRADSKVTKRGESTAPFGYYDVVEETKGDKEDQFGEFNFALDIEAARTVFSTVSAKIIPLEACTLVPQSLRSTLETDMLSSILAQSQEDATTQSVGRENDADELHNARNILRKLLKQYGTTETQWDSISAAIYCNAFGSACGGDNSADVSTPIDSRDMSLSQLGMISFPGCGSKANSTRLKIDDEVNSKHFIFPDFTEKDEVTFHQYLSYLLHG